MPSPADLFLWMTERELVRQRRFVEKLPPPWTDDPVLRTYRFTNVMREYDRTTQWILNNIISPGVLSRDLWITLALARQINLIETLEELRCVGILNQSVWTLDRLREVWRQLDQRQSKGNKVFTSAYMIHADSSPVTSDIWVSKAHYICMIVVGQLVDLKPDISSMETFTRFLSRYESWGGFMAYEIACDLRWAPGWLNKAPDLRTWANPGPGAKRGLNRVANRTFDQPVAYQQCVDEMLGLLKLADSFPFHVKFPRRLEMRDIEHSLCEFDKYRRVIEGQGRPRQMFTPVG